MQGKNFQCFVSHNCPTRSVRTFYGPVKLIAVKIPNLFFFDASVLFSMKFFAMQNKRKFGKKKKSEGWWFTNYFQTKLIQQKIVNYLERFKSFVEIYKLQDIVNSISFYFASEEFREDTRKVENAFKKKHFYMKTNKVFTDNNVVGAKIVVSTQKLRG